MATELRVLCRLSGWLLHEGTKLLWSIDPTGALVIKDGKTNQASYAEGCWGTVQVPPFPQNFEL